MKRRGDIVTGRRGERDQKGSTHLPISVSPRPPVSLSPRLFLLLALLLLTGACRQDMQDQPKMKPYRGTSFFGDGLSARHPVPGTIPRGYLRSDSVLFTGKKEKPGAQASASPVPAAGANANPYA